MLYTAVGHIIKIAPVKKIGGIMEGKWYCVVSGPKINGKRGIKTLYCEPYIEDAKRRVAIFLKCSIKDIFTIENITDTEKTDFKKKYEDLHHKYTELLEKYAKLLETTHNQS